jgi:2-polyprenyl-6-methoxyphenol hydroxylase-like FAD-dependent oxidoreductase
MSEQRAIIIGAGVAGLAAAWWLKRAGWQPVVIERAADLRDAGYMMGLSGPGLEIASRMGLIESLRAAACTVNENVYRDRTGRELLRLRYREFLQDLPYIALRRTALVQALYDSIARSVDVRFSARAVAIENGPDKASVTLDDGTRLDGDLVIAADGFRSWARREIFGPDSAFFTPLGYRFATYDLDDELDLGADFLSFTEPGHIVEYYTLQDRKLAALHVWCSNESGPVAPDQRWSLIERVSATTHPSVRRMIAIAKKDAVPIVDDLTLVHVPAWSKDRVLLLGDAAHCLTLISGQGAGMAMASAAILSEELGKAPLGAALKQHEQRLRPSIQKLQDRSRKMGKLFIPATPVSFHLRNLMLRNMPRRWLGRYFLNAVKSEILASSDVTSRS